MQKYAMLRQELRVKEQVSQAPGREMGTSLPWSSIQMAGTLCPAIVLKSNSLIDLTLVLARSGLVAHRCKIDV